MNTTNEPQVSIWLACTRLSAECGDIVAGTVDSADEVVRRDH